MTILHMPAIPVDANGVPSRHREARDAAVSTLRRQINDLPESVYHLNQTDAEWVTDDMLTAYLHALRTR